jgi:hypothetical protein
VFSTTSTSTVGFPLESRISLALTALILAILSVNRSAREDKSNSGVEIRAIN